MSNVINFSEKNTLLPIGRYFKNIGSVQFRYKEIREVCAQVYKSGLSENLLILKVSAHLAEIDPLLSNDQRLQAAQFIIDRTGFDKDRSLNILLQEEENKKKEQEIRNKRKEDKKAEEISANQEANLYSHIIGDLRIKSQGLKPLPIYDEDF